MLRVLFYHFSLYCFETGSLTDPGGRLMVSQPQWPCCPLLRSTAMLGLPFPWHAENVNSGMCKLTVSQPVLLPTEAYPQTQEGGCYILRICHSILQSKGHHFPWVQVMPEDPDPYLTPPHSLANASSPRLLCDS